MSDASGAASTRLRRNALSNVLGRAASGVLWVLLTPFVLARLGPERFGVWSLFFAVSGYIATLDLGMASSVARFLAVGAAHGDREAVRGTLARSLVLACGLGALWSTACIVLRGAFVVGFHVPAPLRTEVEFSLMVFAASLLVFCVAQVLQGGLIGLQRLHLSNLWFLAGLLVHATVLLAGLARGGGLMVTAVAMVAGNTVCGLLSAFSLERALRGLPHGEGTQVSWRQLMGFGGVVQATNAFAMGQLQVGKFLLGLLGQLTWVTQFELGFRVANALWGLPQLVQGAVIPAAAHASALAGREELRHLYRWSCRWQFAFAGWVLGGLWLTAPALFAAWVGPGYTDAVTVTEALAVAFAVATLAGPASAVTRGAGWPGLETAWVGIALTLNVAASFPLIARFGTAGAAYAMGLSYAVASTWLIPVLHRRLELPVKDWFVPIASPRLLVPAAAAIAVRFTTRHLEIGSRAEGLAVTLLQGALFTVAVVALSWPTGDPQAVWQRVRIWVPGALRPANGGVR